MDRGQIFFFLCIVQKWIFFRAIQLTLILPFSTFTCHFIFCFWGNQLLTMDQMSLGLKHKKIEKGILFNDVLRIKLSGKKSQLPIEIAFFLSWFFFCLDENICFFIFSYIFHSLFELISFCVKVISNSVFLCFIISFLLIRVKKLDYEFVCYQRRAFHLILPLFARLSATFSSLNYF